MTENRKYYYQICVFSNNVNWVSREKNDDKKDGSDDETPDVANDSNHTESENDDNRNNVRDEKHLSGVEWIAPIKLPDNNIDPQNLLTTMRNPSTWAKKKKWVNYKKGTHIKTKMDDVFHALTSDTHKKCALKCGNVRNYYGEIMSGNSNQGHSVKFDNVPAWNQVAYRRHRSITNSFEEEKEEVECTNLIAETTVEKRKPISNNLLQFSATRRKTWFLQRRLLI